MYWNITAYNGCTKEYYSCTPIDAIEWFLREFDLSYCDIKSVTNLS
jgi:hypothetical protein